MDSPADWNDNQYRIGLFDLSKPHDSGCPDLQAAVVQWNVVVLTNKTISTVAVLAIVLHTRPVFLYLEDIHAVDLFSETEASNRRYLP